MTQPVTLSHYLVVAPCCLCAAWCAWPQAERPGRVDGNRTGAQWGERHLAFSSPFLIRRENATLDGHWIALFVIALAVAEAAVAWRSP